jgi:hypothetical protein
VSYEKSDIAKYRENVKKYGGGVYSLPRWLPPPSKVPLYLGTPPNKHTPEQYSLVTSKALVKLWQGVADSLLFRHPDPGVTVECQAGRAAWTDDDTVYGRFRLLNVRDTRNPDIKYPDFYMPWKVSTWPGREAAELFLVAAWTMYGVHEATELVLRKVSLPKAKDGDPYPGGARVVDVHATPGSYTELNKHHWSVMGAADKGTPEAMVRTIAFLVGDDVAEVIVHRHKDSAERELRTEQDYLIAHPHGRPA